jgi:hypothetical protein
MLISLCFRIFYYQMSTSSKKGKFIPVRALEVGAPTFSDIRFTDGGKVVSPTRRPLFYPQEDSWYSFLLEAESAPGQWCGWKD